MSIFGNDWPIKPLTAEQKLENDDWNRRREAAEKAYEDGKERLRAELAEKYGVTWEPETEGDWIVDGFAPHSPEPDFDRFTPEHRRAWDNHQATMGMMLDNMKMLTNVFTAGKTIQYGDSEAFNSGYAQRVTFKRIEDKA